MSHILKLDRADLSRRFGDDGATLLLALEAEYHKGRFGPDTWIPMPAQSWLRAISEQQRQQNELSTGQSVPQQPLHQKNLRTQLSRLCQAGVLQRRFRNQLFSFRLNWNALCGAKPQTPVVVSRKKRAAA